MVRRMTKLDALDVVIRHAAANVAGVGTGIRAEVRPLEKVEVVRAIAILYPYAYGRSLDDSDRFNLRLPCSDLV